MLREGSGAVFVIALFAFALIVYYLLEASKGRTQEFRRIKVLDAIDDGIDRAVEMGRPVLHGMGAYAYLSGLFAAMTLAAVNVMRYSMRQCVRKGADLRFNLPCNPEVAPLIDGIYREVASAEGKPEAYIADHIHYFGNDEAGYRAGLLNLLATYRPTAYILCGAITGTGDAIATMAARSIGSLVIGGQCRQTHQGSDGPISFDYYMALADVYAAGAIISGDAEMQSNLISADITTYLAVVLILIGAILAVAGLPVASWLTV